MGIKCPNCGSTKTKSYASSQDKMHCRECAHRWKPSKLRGGTYVLTGGDGISPKIRVFVPKGRKFVKTYLGYKIVKK